MTLLLIAGIASGLIGLVLLLVGWIGRRVHDHPTCRGCKYDLSGVWPESVRCPECGVDINTATMGRRRAVQRGFRAKRRVFVWLGLLLFLAGGGGSAVMLSPAIRNINWHDMKPDWWLVMESDADSPATAERALVLLNQRFEVDSLSDENVNTLIERGLTIQADASRKWYQGWGNFLEYAWFSGRLTMEEKIQFVRNSAFLEIDVPESIILGNDFFVGIERTEVRRSDRDPFTSNRQFSSILKSGIRVGGYLRNVEIDGQPIIALEGAARHPDPIDHGRDGGFGFPAPDLEIGEHTLTCDYVMWGDFSRGSDHVRDVLAGDTEPLIPIITIHHTARIQIVPLGAQANHPVVPNPALTTEIAHAIHLQSYVLRQNSGSGSRFSGHFIIRNAPVAVAFEVFLRDQKGQEWKLTEVSSSALVDEGAPSRYFTASVQGFKGGRADLVFRSNWEVAARNPQINESWGGEVVFPNIEFLPFSEEPQPAANDPHEYDESNDN